MKKNILSILAVASCLLFQQCTRVNNDTAVSSVLLPVEVNGEMSGEEEEQDGIEAAQKMEFEMTKDISLGYVPKQRLVSAYEKLIEDRKNSPASFTAALSWTERGPNTDAIGPSNGNTRGTQAATDVVTSGRMRALWVDIADGTVWAGSVSGGLWHTTDITSTSPAVWSLVNDFIGNLAISSICQDPTNTNIMYFGTGEKVYSFDAVQGGGIWRSTDHGVTWSLMPGSNTYYNVSRIVCDAAGNLYVATVAGSPAGSGGLLRYNKVAGTWDNISPAGLSTRVTEMRISNTGRLHVVCGYYNTAPASSGLRYTDNPATVTAATWTAPTTAIPNTLTAYNVELAVASNTLYAECSNSTYLVGGIYKSTDGGANWAAVTTPPNTTAEPSILPGAQAWYDLAIGCDPNNPDIVIAGGLNYYRSTNGGTTWTQITRWVGTALPYVHADHHAVVWNTNGTGAGTRVLMATDGGLFYSNDNGVTYTDRNDGLRIKQFYSCAPHPSTTNYFIGGTQDNGTHQLTSAGLGGSTEVIGGDGGFTHIDEDEPQYQFSAFTGTSFIRSTNGGANWSSVVNYGGGQFINPSDYDNGSNRMYFSFGNGNYARWNNPQTGTSANSIAIADFNSRPVLSVQVSPYTPNRVFFGTDQGRVVRVDNAHTGTPTSTNISGSGMSASTVSCIAVGTNDNNLIATFSNYGSVHVWVSTTGGGAAGWTNISGNLPDIPVRWAMYYPEDNTKAIVATEMGIYETDLINGAATNWVQNLTFPVVKTNMLQYRKSDGLLLAATHGRGLWTASIPFTNPYVRFATSYATKTEETSATTGSCRPYRDYVVNMTVDQAPVGNATVTVSVSGGPTATQGVDFDFTTNGNFAAPSTSLTFASGSTTPQPVTIRVYNDAEVEGTESFTLNYTVSGTTNALVAPSNAGYTLLINDNDANPVVSAYNGTYNLGTANTTLSTQTPFRSSLQKHRIQYLFRATELTAAGITGAGYLTSMTINVVTKNSTQPFNGFTIALGNTAVTSLSAGFTAADFEVYTGNYSSVVGNNVFNFTTPFFWDGTSNVVVNFCFDNAPGTPDPLSDVMQGTSAPFGVGVRASTYSNSVVGSGCSLGAAFIADSRITAMFNAQGGNVVESTLNANRTEYVGGNGTYNFYNGLNIISAINSSSANLGCVTSNVFEAGNTWQIFEAGLRSQKVVEITPTTNSGATYTVSLYYTAAELAGQTPATLKIAKTNAATMAAANAGNTVTATTNVTAFGTGYIFTATFTGFSKFFLINSSVALPVTLVSFSGTLNASNNAVLNWRVSNEINLRNYEVERSYDGTQFTSAGSVAATTGGGLVKDYTFTDAVIAKPVNYYRLKMIDANGRFRYSDIVILNNNNGTDFVQLLKNPVQNSIPLSINNKRKEKITTELYSTSGQLMSKWEIGAADGSVQLPFTNSIAAGVYTLRITVGTKTTAIQIVKQ